MDALGRMYQELPWDAPCAIPDDDKLDTMRNTVFSE